MKSKIISLTMILLILLTGCSKQVLLDEQDSKKLNYNFKIQDLNDVDKTLQKQKYGYSTSIDKKYIAVITYNSKDASMKQYILMKDEIKDITIPKDSEFVISLHRNSTITYTWNIENNIDNGIIKFEKQSFIKIPPPNTPKDGEGYDRQNLYFKCLKPRDQKIVLRYEHDTNKDEPFFQISLNIKVE